MIYVCFDVLCVAFACGVSPNNAVGDIAGASSWLSAGGGSHWAKVTVSANTINSNTATSNNQYYSPQQGHAAREVGCYIDYVYFAIIPSWLNYVLVKLCIYVHLPVVCCCRRTIQAIVESSWNCLHEFVEVYS